MSTILKALRRLEEQKSEATQRPLRDEVVLTPSRKTRRNGAVIAIAAAIAFTLVGAAMVALFDRVPDTGEAGRVAGDVAAPPGPAEGLGIADERATGSIAAENERDFRGLAPDIQVESEPDFEIARPVPPKPRQLIPTMQVDARPVGEQKVPTAGSARPSPLPPAVEPEYLEEEVVPTPVARSAAPVHVDRTQWHPSPERRVAWVEIEGTTGLREVREGERIGPYVVREIEPAAVLFSDGSAQVRHEVGR